MTASLLLPILSYICGWAYFLSWSLSFYPQPLLNYYRRSTSGTTIDFPAINILGFAAYFISTTAFLYSPEIRRQYAERNHGLTPTVKLNDVAFAAHATICSIISMSQYFPRLWGFEDRGRRSERVSRTVMGICIGSVIGVGGVALMVATYPGQNVATGWAGIDIVSFSSPAAEWRLHRVKCLLRFIGIRHLICQACCHSRQIHATVDHQLQQQIHPRLVDLPNPPRPCWWLPLTRAVRDRFIYTARLVWDYWEPSQTRPG